MKSSGVPSASTIGPAIGMAKASVTAPSTPPTMEARKPTPRAIAALPCLASACPSMAVGADAGEPGAPTSTDVMVSDV